MLWRLLKTHVSKSQLAGFALANLVGLAIVVLAVLFYGDVRPVFDDDESFLRKDYLVVTRNVSGLGAMMGESGEFGDSDIADLEAQPWCRSVGRFTGSEFSVQAAIGLGGGGRVMRSQFFFESIPAGFIDVAAGEWTFDPARPEVPVIVSRDYLSLYNFGFAATQGLPRVSEGQVGMLPLSFTLYGNGRDETLPGRIVGFSSRLNTVIVPEEFMAWANARFGRGGTRPPVRLIVEVGSPGDMAIGRYMDEHHLDVAGDKANSSKANQLLTVVVGVVVAVGAVISALSFFVLMLSVMLLLQKNTRKLQDLLLLGYSPSQVARPYMMLVLAVNAAVLVLAVAVAMVARWRYLPLLHAMGVAGGSAWPALLAGTAVMALATAGNLLAIRRRVGKLWTQA